MGVKAVKAEGEEFPVSVWRANAGVFLGTNDDPLENSSNDRLKDVQPCRVRTREPVCLVSRMDCSGLTV